MAGVGIIGPIPGVNTGWQTMPVNVSGRTFNSINTFKDYIGNAPAVLRPGSSVSITIGDLGPGGRRPSVSIPKHSAFTAKIQGPNLIISAKADAKLGKNSKLTFVQPGLPGMKPTKTPVVFEVGTGIRMG